MWTWTGFVDLAWPDHAEKIPITGYPSKLLTILKKKIKYWERATSEQAIKKVGLKCVLA